MLPTRVSREVVSGQSSVDVLTVVRAILVPAAIGLALTAPATAASHQRGCARPGSHVQQRAGDARLFLYRGELYACRPGVRVELGDTEANLPLTRCPTFVALPRLQPRFVAWYANESCDDQQLWFIKVRKLERDGPHRKMLDGVAPCGETCPSGGIGPPSAVALTRGGSVAWIAQDAFAADGTREVWKAVWGRPKARVARASGIDPHQLQWQGSDVAFVVDGRTTSTGPPQRSGVIRRHG